MEPRQRPAGQEVKPLAEKHEDVVYHRYHMARVTAELVRPDVSGPNWGGYDLDQMKIAFLARAVQTRLPYIHFCTSNYCLRRMGENKSTHMRIPMGALQSNIC